MFYLYVNYCKARVYLDINDLSLILYVSLIFN